MLTRFLPDRVYWIADGELRLGATAAAPKGARIWISNDVNASADTLRRFLFEAVAAGLPESVTARVLSERGLQSGTSQ